MTIKILIPKENGKWQINKGAGGHCKKFVSALKILEFLERWVMPANGVKTAVVVDYGNGYDNETETTTDGNYLIHATACFLEDFLSKETLKRIEKKYRS